jgi:hypothetical protein
MPEINATLFNGAYLDDAFPNSGSQMEASFVSILFLFFFACRSPELTINLQDFGPMFSSLSAGALQQELFISPLDNATGLDSHSAYPPVPPNQYQLVSSVTPPSTYSGSPAPSDFSLPLHAPQPQRVFETPSQVQTKGDMANLDMTAYAQGLANFGIQLDMGLSYAVPEMPPLSFDISGQILAEALQQPQPRSQPSMGAPIAVPFDPSFTFNEVINEF